MSRCFAILKIDLVTSLIPSVASEIGRASCSEISQQRDIGHTCIEYHNNLHFMDYILMGTNIRRVHRLGMLFYETHMIYTSHERIRAVNVTGVQMCVLLI